MNRKILSRRFSIAATAPVSLAPNSDLALSSIQHNPATRFNRSRRAINSTRQPCKRRRNVIAAYNLAQRMASLPQTLYTSYSNLGRAGMDCADPACEHLWQLTALDECRDNRLWSGCRESDLQSSAHGSDLWIFHLSARKGSRQSQHREQRSISQML